jgi:Ca-activated chloride channel family protein
LRGVANPARALRPWLVALAAAAAIVALAGPRSGVVRVPVPASEANRVIVIDVSLSMAAEDVGASRFDAAKAIARRLIDVFPGRVGLVVFESRADVISPLTSDTSAVAALLETVEPGEIGDPGSDIASGLGAALRLLTADPTQKGDIILITDGEDQGTRTDGAIAALHARNIPVHAIVVGSGLGATIPEPNGGELRDDHGDVVHTYATTDVSKRIARGTGGELYINPFAAHALDALASRNTALAKTRMVEIPVERYQWPLAAAFVLFVLGSIANRGTE